MTLRIGRSSTIPSRWEIAWFALGVVALVAGEILVLHAWAALARPLWLDEIHTVLLAERQSVAGSIRSLASGSDFNPPTLYLMYRFVGALTGGLSDVTMRVVAIVTVLGAVVIVYWLLRDTFRPDASALGAIAVWAQQVVVAVAFDARFYGPWLLGASALLLAVRRETSRSPSVWSALSLALISVFVCTIHYFGVVSLIAALGIAIARAGRPRRALLRALSPAVAGPLALLACAPIYLGQRAALSIPTWIPRASVTDHLFLLAVALIPPATVVALLGWGASRLLQPLTPQQFLPPEPPALGAGPWLLLGQAAVPVLLAMFSLLVQPSTQPRYWIVGSLVAAPVVAFAASRSQLTVRWVVAVAIVMISATLVSGEGAAGREREARFAEDVSDATRATSDGSLLVARRRHTLYPLLRALPRLNEKAALLDASALRGRGQQLAIIERDVARVHERLYGFPRIVSPADLSTISSFYFLEVGETQSPDTSEFPGFDIQRVAPRLFRLQRRDLRSGDRRSR